MGARDDLMDITKSLNEFKNEVSMQIMVTVECAKHCKFDQLIDLEDHLEMQPLWQRRHDL